MTWIRTHSGSAFHFRAPNYSVIDIMDIGRALSRICRFTGHTAHFYSVAQHCVEVSRLVPDHLALEGLLHDAAEAYLGDVSSPLKALLPDYRKLEAEVEQAIAETFQLEYPWNDAIKRADVDMLRLEQEWLMSNKPAARSFSFWQHHSGETTIRTLRALPPDDAYEDFLRRYVELRAERPYRSTQAEY